MASMNDVVTDLMHKGMNVYMIENAQGVNNDDIFIMSMDWIARKVCEQPWNTSRPPIFNL
jgi:hypothetical protein